MGKGGAGNNSVNDYGGDGRDTIPYNLKSPYFQAEGDDPSDVAFFLGQFEESDGEFYINEYWTDPETGFQMDTVGPLSGRSTGGALGERLDDLRDSGYNLSIYDLDDVDGFEVSAALSEDFPRSFTQRVTGLSPQIDHSDGGMTVRGNLDVTPQELYQGAKNADLDESRIWPRVNSVLSKPFQVGME